MTLHPPSNVRKLPLIRRVRWAWWAVGNIVSLLHCAVRMDGFGVRLNWDFFRYRVQGVVRGEYAEYRDSDAPWL